MRNYEIMLSRGFKPVPILTQGESFSVMDEFWKTSDVVGVGGLVGVPLKEKQRFIYEVMKHANGRRVHWLGFVNDQFVKYFRPYMCDSSAFTGADRFGQLMIYAGNGRYRMLKKTDFSKKPDEAVLRKIICWGFNPYQLKSVKNWHGGEALIYLQPISQGAEATRLCVETAMANDWRVSVQVHKYLAVR